VGALHLRLAYYFGRSHVHDGPGNGLATTRSILPLAVDGSFSIFAFNDSPTAGQYQQGRQHTRLEGVQMITWLASGVFASSNDESSS